MRLPLGGSRAWLRAQSAAGAATGATRRWLEQNPPGGHERWQRTNYAGRRVSLLGGPAAAAALTYTSERVSFSGLIEQHPVLDRIDRAGRSW